MSQNNLQIDKMCDIALLTNNVIFVFSILQLIQIDTDD